MAYNISPLHILPPRGLRSHPTCGSRKDGHPNIRIAFPQAIFDALATEAHHRQMPLSTYIRLLVKYGQQSIPKYDPTFAPTRKPIP